MTRAGMAMRGCMRLQTNSVDVTKQLSLVIHVIQYACFVFFSRANLANQTDTHVCMLYRQTMHTCNGKSKVSAVMVAHRSNGRRRTPEPIGVTHLHVVPFSVAPIEDYTLNT